MEFAGGLGAPACTGAALRYRAHRGSGEKVIARNGTPKTERILNLTICLLVSGRYLPKSRIREAVEGYHNLSDAAFERTFERDKDELRSLGVPIEVGFDLALFDDEPGYRILSSSLRYRRSTWMPKKPPWWELQHASGGTRAWPSRREAPSPNCAPRAWNRMPRSLPLWSRPCGHLSRGFEVLWNAVLDRLR